MVRSQVDAVAESVLPKMVTDVRSVEELVQRSDVPVGQVDDVYVVPDLRNINQPIIRNEIRAEPICSTLEMVYKQMPLR